MRFLIIISLVTIFVSCTRSDSPETELSNKSDLKSVSEINRHCGDTLFAAMYHIPATQDFFDNRAQFAGQPVDYFSEMLNASQKENLLKNFEQYFSQEDNNERLVQLSNQFLQWCDANEEIQQLQHQMSHEEFLALLYDSERFGYLFQPFNDRSLFQSKEYSSLDKVASLSSAQSHQILSTLITDLSMQGQSEFENDLNSLRTLIQ
ncbi:hypothetical protein [Rhodohalobacter barkolensis]|uniref:Uncharacterized protein n=1 Tax=Rhodohalobacter barkolensis TaxID=2053187 RepID=A0A2N0VKM3_9BACT|nr:hypothetical protein [Rhodohalobacter barkolensis]PKD44730.1 hypothetical protein CWD77_04500 [Rhodohalobacter barkolensis]